jgi:hypothetical protein
VRSSVREVCGAGGIASHPSKTTKGGPAYDWWNYQHRQMTGIFIGAWSGLPIEGACVWIAATYATAIVFEVVKVVLASERPVRDVLLGEKQGS